LFQEEDWDEAIETDGRVRDGAWVAELTGLMDLSRWGEGARLICRRERPHPGAQLSMFDCSEGYRHTCFITNAIETENDAAVAVLELRHRGHARVEDRVRNWRTAGYRTSRLHRSPRTLTWLAASLVRRLAARLGPDDLPRRRAQESRTEIAPPPDPSRRCGARPPWAPARCCAWTRPGPWASALQRAFLKLRSTFP